MTRTRLVLLVILSASLSAGVTSWLIGRWQPDPSPDQHPEPPSHHDEDFHQWLHAHLKLTPAQLKALKPDEDRFESERARLLEELEAVSADLAHALSDPRKEASQLKPLMTKRQQIQGQIQELVIDHLLEKRSQLTEEQLERYRDWVHESISHGHGE